MVETSFNEKKVRAVAARIRHAGVNSFFIYFVQVEFAFKVSLDKRVAVNSLLEVNVVKVRLRAY